MPGLFLFAVPMVSLCCPRGEGNNTVESASVITLLVRNIAAKYCVYQRDGSKQAGK